MAGELSLELSHVGKSFVNIETQTVQQVLGDVSLRAQAGELICLLGPSGCGKSTILRLIAGLIRPTRGAVLVGGQEVQGPGPDRGMVFQSPTLFPWLTVEKNIAFSLQMAGQARAKHEQVEKMLQRIGLTAHGKDYPAQLSGGMAQRVALARSLINEPEILLLDEPLGALDAFTRMHMQEEILGLHQTERQLMILVTHDVDEAIYMGSRVLVMEPHPGRIIADIPIDLPSKRNRSSALFVEYRNHILELLHFGVKE